MSADERDPRPFGYWVGIVVAVALVSVTIAGFDLDLGVGQFGLLMVTAIVPLLIGDAVDDVRGVGAAARARHAEAYADRIEAREVAALPSLDDLGGVIWAASRADEGTISATGARIVAAAVLAHLGAPVGEVEAS